MSSFAIIYAVSIIIIIKVVSIISRPRKKFGSNFPLSKSKEKFGSNFALSDEPITSEKIPRQKWPFQKKNCLLTKTEQSFYFVLKDILQNDYILFSKVKVGDDILYMSQYSSKRESFRNMVKSRHVDFLVCENASTKPLLAIELDDYSHLRNDRIKRDNFIDEVFQDAGIPIMHVPVSYNYDKEKLLEQIKTLTSI